MIDFFFLVIIHECSSLHLNHLFSIFLFIHVYAVTKPRDNIFLFPNHPGMYQKA